jgi:hypothetical protein
MNPASQPMGFRTLRIISKARLHSLAALNSDLYNVR